MKLRTKMGLGLILGLVFGFGIDKLFNPDALLYFFLGAVGIILMMWRYVENGLCS